LFKNVFSAFVVSAQRYSAALNQPDTIPDASANMLVLVGRYRDKGREDPD
jgi:hypothetical protein